MPPNFAKQPRYILNKSVILLSWLCLLQAFRNGQIEKTDHLHLLLGAPGSETVGVYSMDLAYHRSNATLLINTETPFHGNTYIIGMEYDDKLQQ